MNKILLSILFCLLVASSIFAQDETENAAKTNPTKLLFVSTPDISGKDDVLKLLVSKIAIDVVLRTNLYQLVFTPPQEEIYGKLSMFRLNMMIKEEKKGYFAFDFSITNVKAFTSVHRVWAKNIPRRFLLLQTRMSLYELFLGKAYVNKNKDKIEEEHKKPDDPEIESFEGKKGRLSPSDQKKNELEQKAIKSSLKPEGADSSFGPPLTVEGMLRKKAREDQEKQMALRLEEAEELELLKEDIAQKLALARVKESKRGPKDKKRRNGGVLKLENPEEEVQEEDTDTEKKEEEAKETEVKELEEVTPQQLVFSDQEIQREKRKHLRERGKLFLLSGELMNRSVQSHYLVDVGNNLNYYGPRFTLRMNTDADIDNHDQFIFSVALLKSYVQDLETEKEIPTVKIIDIFYAKALEILPLDFIFGFTFEQSYFLNIADEDEGLMVATNNLLWLKGGMEFGFQIWKANLFTEFYAGKGFVMESDFLGAGNLKLDGTRMGMGLDFVYRKKYRIGIKLEEDRLTAANDSKFSLIQNSFYARLTYLIR